MKTQFSEASVRYSAFGALVTPFVTAGVLSSDAVQIIDVLTQRWPATAPGAALGLAFVLEAQLRGHAGLEITKAKDVLVGRAVAEGGTMGSDPAEASPWPEDAADALASWQADALRCPMLLGGDAPFVVNPIAGGGTLLQSRRMAWEEAEVARALVTLAAPVLGGQPRALVVDDETVREAARRLLTAPDDADPPTDEALFATPAAKALFSVARQRLTIITGGPGTGKTWSIKRALALLLEAARKQGLDLRVVLCAPTGKAGVRMGEAMSENLDELAADEAIKTGLRAIRASTLHRLLKIRPGSGKSRFGPNEPLPADVIVLDEASMVDLTLMRRLLVAVGPTTRLIMLGDRDQLPSVDVGSVLSDIVRQPLAHLAGTIEHGGPLGPCVVRFDVNHRSGKAPSLAKVVDTLQRDRSRVGDEDVVRALTRQGAPEHETLPGRLRPLGRADDGRPTEQQLETLLEPWLRDTLQVSEKQANGNQEVLVTREVDGYLTLIGSLLKSGGRAAVAREARTLLAAFDRYRVLAVHRRGPLGVSGLTKSLTPRFAKVILEAFAHRPVRAGKGGKAHTLDATHIQQRRAEGLPTRGGLFLGQPVLVTENAYDVDLWNGDIGLVLPSPENPGRLEVVFPPTDAFEAGDAAEEGYATKDKPTERPLRRRAITRLPQHTSALVLTVHKSQGSQYAHVALVLADHASPIQTRELVYTGITRASERVTWLGDAAILREAFDTVVQRGSALAERIDPGTPPQPPARTRTPAAVAPAPAAAEPVVEALVAPAVVATPASAPDAPPLARAIAAVLAAAAPLARADITKAADIDDTTWAAIRASLEASPDIVRMGTKRGTRYASNRVYDELIVEAVWTADIDEGDGALTGHVTATFEQKWGPAEDNAWSAAIARLLKSGRVTKTGAKRGTRYRVYPVPHSKVDTDSVENSRSSAPEDT